MATSRRSIALAASAATALTLGATSLVMNSASAAEMPLKDYTLTWGIKQSFRDYVITTGTMAPNGTITTADGATQAEKNGAFTFTGGTGTYDSTAHTVKLAFKGSVTFKSPAMPDGHGFEIKVTDVKFDSAAKSVTADVTKNGTLSEDVPLAEVTPSQTMKDMPTKLTDKAGELLHASYAGAAGDPLTVTAPAKPPVTPSPSPSTSKPNPSPSTGNPSPSPSTSTPSTPKPSPSTSAPTKPPAGQIVDGKLSWGVKESFRRYISGGGEVKTAGGATKTASGYDFPYKSAKFDAKGKKVDAGFGGSVQFLYTAHGIDMTFSDVQVRTNGTSGTLLVDVKTAKGTQNDVEFATLDLAKASYTVKDDVLLLDRIPAAFTEAGAKAFANDEVGSIYKPGDAIDPVTVALSLDKDTALPGTGGTTGGSTAGGTSTTGGGSVGGSVGGGGNLAATGSEVPAGPLLGAAAAVVAAGAGVVFAARRRRTVEGGEQA
ncbi:HtaA domain-containing protein [Streptomyces sp. TRM66268-LWL]|uniref:HtaA domain-containing protein n=1 Tax=Streptomyces polyasparticus TaxID=2767826 RepID=A0ABR7SBB5_9ACTN|nr:HtaA domain-containing protein [Streptomyces polyasparticus]MBC9712444.1 HtaA domain-containing protein [Streptomyces polyasparticus]